MRGDQTAAEAAKLMEHENLGSILVRSNDGNLGIIVQGDLVFKVLAASRNPDMTPLKEIATFNPVTIPQEASLDSAMRLMSEKNIRRLIVVDELDRPVGLLVERFLFVQLVSRLLDVRVEGPKSWMERFINDVTEAAIHEDD